MAFLKRTPSRKFSKKFQKSYLSEYLWVNTSEYSDPEGVYSEPSQKPKMKLFCLVKNLSLHLT